MTRVWCLLVLLTVSVGCRPLAIVRGPNRNTSSVEVEVDWTTPQPPTQAMLNALRGSMANICDPAVSVSFNLDDDLSGQGHGTWTDLDCRTFAVSHKDSDDFYMLWAAGVWDKSPQVGGYSWNKRDFVVFPDVYGGSSGNSQLAALHEWCHCLGLVDKFLEMSEPHKHAAGNHCDQGSCLMKPATWSSMLCPKCMADLTDGEEK